MKKGAKIGLGITILFVSVIVGIASIPDEVLNETTTAIENEAKIFSAPEKPEPAAPKPAKPFEPKAPEPSTPEPAAPSTPEPAAPSTPEPDATTTPDLTEPEPSEPETPEVTENSEPEPDASTEETKGKVIRVEVRDGVGTSLS